MFAVVIHEKGGAERRELFETSEISVGRVQGNDLMLSKGNVSKRHARLLHRDGRFIVTDLNSTNGTYVNRRRITQATIVREGDRIFIGDFVLRVESTDPTGDAPPAASASTPSPRAPAPSISDSHPSGQMRPAVEEDDELTGSMPRMVAAPRPAPSNVVEGAGSVPLSAPARSNRVTQGDEEDTQRALALDIIAELVSRVLRSVPALLVEGSRGAELVERVEPALREAWAQVSGERSGKMPSDGVLEQARAELLELGPLGDLLADGNVSEIAFVGPRRVTVTRGGRARSGGLGFSCEQSLRLSLNRLCAAAGEPLPLSSLPFERRIADGTSVSAVQGTAGEWLVLIQKPRKLSGSLEDLVRRGTISRAIAVFLYQCLTARLNILVIGPRDGGAELVLAALAAAVPDEDVLYCGELDASVEGARRLVIGGPVEQTNQAVRLATRMPLGRLMVELGSASLTEAVCSAVCDGGDGVIATRTGSSLRRGLLRLVSELAVGRASAPARELLAGTFEVVIEVARLRDERHRVLRVAELVGTQADDFELADVFTFVADRTAAGGLIEGSFVPASTPPPVTEVLRLRGVATDSSLFSRPPSR